MSVANQSLQAAKCRGCGLELKGSPYSGGGLAYHPDTGKQCKANYYGGWVCSPQCDHRASLSHEQTMPGHDASQRQLGCFSAKHFSQNWSDK